LGDVILTTPLVRAIRRAQPQAHLTFVTRPAYAPVLEGNPHLDRVVTLEPGESPAALAERLAGGPAFDFGLDLHRNLRSLALRRLIPARWSSYRKGRTNRWRLLWLGGATSPDGFPVAERYFYAAAALGVQPDGGPAEVFPSKADRDAAAAICRPPFVVLAPGAQHRSKRWPARHWRALAGHLLARGLRVVATGTAAERDLLSQDGVVDAFGCPLGVCAALLARAEAVVANDSGLMHLAPAVGRPVVALFGPTVRAFGFVPYRARSVVVERRMFCRPCSATGGAFCPLLHHRCLAGIDPGDVAATVLEAA
jgi:heptosyltransferase-2